MTRVSQEFIQLLNLPKVRLQKIAKELDISVPTSARKWDIARLVSGASPSKLAPRTSGWVFAGRTSVTYIRLGDGGAIETDDLVDVLTDMCDGVDPFENDIRPETLTRKPTLVEASSEEGKIFLSFGLKRPVAKVLSDFEVEEVHGDEFFAVVIRPEVAVMEVRTNNQRAQNFGTTWVAELTERLFGPEEDSEGGS